MYYLMRGSVIYHELALIKEIAMNNILKKLYDIITKPAPKKILIPIPVRANNGR
ncbi:MAG: hypothetical protein K0Q66_1796 [Chitinophagaceae bacterium]|jgi:hypothetical protein|nr:hypothetical protein [Chitinophagaceae bacterium]